MPVKRLLIVQAESPDLAVPSGLSCFYLSYRFTGQPRRDAFSAWELARNEHVLQVAVDAVCASVNGSFEQQALNRFCAALIQQHRIDAVWVRGLNGCTLDLPRLAALMGVPAISEVIVPFDAPYNEPWLRDALQRSHAVMVDDHDTRQWLQSFDPELSLHTGNALESLLAQLPGGTGPRRYDYSLYEFCQRDHPLIMRIQQGDVEHFHGCQRVLDLGCGAGLFLSQLQQRGIGAVGVERNPIIADYGRGMGLEIITADALAYLQQGDDTFDGIYCSHFVEHLPFEAVEQLLQLIEQRLAPGGVLVLAFPDPESIRSQLLGFWRDPEHVRFYHPELIASICRALGLTVEWRSDHQQPHEVTPFPLQPEPIDLPPPPAAEPATPRRGLLARLGLVKRGEYQALQQRTEQLQQQLSQQHAALQALHRRTDTLWAVNRTWAWNDNAVLKLRKPHDQSTAK